MTKTMTHFESLKTAREAARGLMDQEGDFVTQVSHAAWMAATEAYDQARQAAEHALEA